MLVEPADGHPWCCLGINDYILFTVFARLHFVHYFVNTGLVASVCNSSCVGRRLFDCLSVQLHSFFVYFQFLLF